MIIIRAKHCVISKWILRSVRMQNSIYCVRETFSAYRSSCTFPSSCVFWVLRPVFWDVTPCTLLDTPECNFSGNTPNQKKLYGCYTGRSFFFPCYNFALQQVTSPTGQSVFWKCYKNKRIFLSSSNVLGTFFRLNSYPYSRKTETCVSFVGMSPVPVYSSNLHDINGSWHLPEWTEKYKSAP
jgi:hypothetical protein